MLFIASNLHVEEQAGRLLESIIWSQKVAQ